MICLSTKVRIESLKSLASPTYRVAPVYLGLHEENDPERRLMGPFEGLRWLLFRRPLRRAAAAPRGFI